MRKLIVSIIAGLMILGTVGPMGPLAMTEQIKAEELDNNHIFITSFYDEDYKNLISLTKGLKEGDTLKITIMSPGGLAIPMIAMVNHLLSLKERGVYIITESAGLAASAGACLWLIGDERIVHDGDLIMFHMGVVRDNWGSIVPMDQLPPENRYVLEQCNWFVRQFLLNILRDTELVNELLNSNGNLDQENSNSNWFTGREVFDMGVATTIIENV